MSLRHLIITLFLFVISVSFAQKKDGKSKMVTLKYCDRWVEDKINNPGVRDLIGNVSFEDGDATMYCDSARQFTEKNAFNAYGNVHIIKADSINIYGDELLYDGNTKLARLRRNVKLINNNSQLTIETEKLDYDLNTDIGFYFDGGTVTDTSFVLNSIKGYYFVNTGIVNFKNDVKVKTSGSDIFTDTLLYDTNTEIISILGPTNIYTDSVHLYSEDGWHDPRNNYSELKHNSFIQKGAQIIEGEHLVYDGTDKKGEAFKWVVITDTLQQIKIKGKRGTFTEATDYAFVTDSALFVQYSGFDSLFLHADTLSFEPDTNDFRLMKAYHNVKFFRFDIQGKCDSIVYSTYDSVINMYKNPIMWSLNNQMTGDEIHVISKNDHVEQIDMVGDAFLISRVDSIRFNQIKGKKISGYIERNMLRKIYVDGNTESLYYLIDGPYIVGINKAESPYLTIYMKGNKIEKVIMSPKPVGQILDPTKVTQAQLTLENFKWRINERPFTPWEIFKPDPLPAPTVEKKL
ncbi:OstA-like protein [Saccharicrinis sp. FJH2]|uniref:OstA-like protein n=1 Tax=Saccharicrinis sp. FJH65 TaxID=3344659 RepID=UPI0035F4CAC4